MDAERVDGSDHENIRIRGGAVNSDDKLQPPYFQLTKTSLQQDFLWIPLCTIVVRVSLFYAALLKTVALQTE